MNQTPTISALRALTSASLRHAGAIRSFFAGLLVPCGFAPIHMPGLAILGIALLFAQLRQQTIKQSFYTGFVFGLGFFGLGVSWIYVSIYHYGHLNPLLAALITLIFVSYLSLFPACVTMVYQRLAANRSSLFNCFLFSALWCLGEYLRSTFMSGFPWLLLGVGQFDSPLKYLLPVVGVFGVSFVTCLSATLLAAGAQTHRAKRYPWIMACVAILITPTLLKNQEWTTTSASEISVGVIQANISMRDKWDERLFWQILKRYEVETLKLMGKKQLIVMPESAIPVPINYVSDYLNDLDTLAKKSGSAILLGIPQPATTDNSFFYNTLTALGTGQGSYSKQHLVLFGEEMPSLFEKLSQWLSVPAANIKAGKSKQALMTVQNHPIASLICYEVGYPQLLRNQLPRAEWIVAISDDGWFGHSLAVYQQLQMSQVLSMQTGRYQVVANNDGLSSVIDVHGDIVDSLPVFSAGILDALIKPAKGSSPWVCFGDTPWLMMCLVIVLMRILSAMFARKLA